MTTEEEWWFRGRQRSGTSTRVGVVLGIGRQVANAARVTGMASTSARVAARTRARDAQRKVLAARADRDTANMDSLTEFFTAAEEIEAARRRQAGALAAIRQREGTLTAAAALAGLTLGEARTLLAVLTPPVRAPADAAAATSTTDPVPHTADASDSSESAV